MPQLFVLSFIKIPHIKERIDTIAQRDVERIVTQCCRSGKNNNQLIILMQMKVTVAFIDKSEYYPSFFKRSFSYWSFIVKESS